MAVERVRYLAALLTGLMISSAAAGQRHERIAPHGWSERGIFVLGSLVFDVRGRFFRSGPTVDRIEDCSNGEYYCLRTAGFELVLPRRCGPLAEGQVWRVGTAETRILRIDRSRALPVAYLGDPARKSIVYRYGLNRGIEAIYWDPEGENDLVGVAGRGDLAEWVRGHPRRARLHHQLNTFDAFGRCRQELPGRR
jgi:hypothetical protein